MALNMIIINMIIRIMCIICRYELLIDEALRIL